MDDHMMNTTSVINKFFDESYGQTFVAFNVNEMPLEDEGTCSFQDGSSYSGCFKANLFHGKGTFVWQDGSRYEGQWDGGMPHGLGTMLLPDGYRYEGEWQNGVADGIGTETLPDGGRYSGQWKDGLKEGDGEIIFADGKSTRVNGKTASSMAMGSFSLPMAHNTKESGRKTPSLDRAC
jgi:hypothetical protein